MTEEQIALARRAVACKGWRWIAGMKAIRHEEHCTSWFRIEETLRRLAGDWASALPDLTDPATLGCLLALVREAWGDHATSFANGYEEPQNVWVVHNGRFSSDDYGHEIAKGSTEVEALVVALETAQ
jgi:hypothetical protein